MNIIEQYLNNNQLEEHELIQGEPEWDAFRFEHDGSSEIASALGLDKKNLRNDMLHAKSSGIPKMFSAWLQENVLDKGHKLEALARPIIEKMIGTRLYPMVYSRGRPSASCDGIKMDGTIGWEHKQWNESLAEAVRAGELPDTHMPQVQQQLLITGAEKWIFTVSDGTEEKMVSMEVLPDPAWFERILAGWEQFNKDCENYQHIEHAEKPIADVVIELPALFIHAKGEITTNNMHEFGIALTAKLEEVRAIKLITDQDFSNAEAAAKQFRDTCDKLKIAKAQMLEQTVSIGEAARMMDAWHEQLRVTALDLEKRVKEEKLNKQTAIILAVKVAYAEHIDSLESEINPIRLNLSIPDFSGALKGKRVLSAWHNAVDTLLSQEKSKANMQASDIRAKLAWCKENAAGMSFLFPDLQQIINKPLDDFILLIQSRIKVHKETEARKEAELRAKAEAEAAAKLEAEKVRIQAEADRKAREDQEVVLASERIRIQAEERAKTESEAAARAKLEAERASIFAEAKAKAEADLEKANRDAKPVDQTETVIAHQDEIAEFLKLHDFGKSEGKIRTILVEFVKFQESRK